MYWDFYGGWNPWVGRAEKSSKAERIEQFAKDEFDKIREFVAVGKLTFIFCGLFEQWPIQCSLSRSSSAHYLFNLPPPK